MSTKFLIRGIFFLADFEKYFPQSLLLPYLRNTTHPERSDMLVINQYKKCDAIFSRNIEAESPIHFLNPQGENCYGIFKWGVSINSANQEIQESHCLWIAIQKFSVFNTRDSLTSSLALQLSKEITFVPLHAVQMSVHVVHQCEGECELKGGRPIAVRPEKKDSQVDIITHTGDIFLLNRLKFMKHAKECCDWVILDKMEYGELPPLLSYFKREYGDDPNIDEDTDNNSSSEFETHQLTKLSLAALKKNLLDKNLPQSGKKIELLERLALRWRMIQRTLIGLTLTMNLPKQTRLKKQAMMIII
eukprot:Pompholyxophrys_punicea_v1_NODE_59_length_4107_cov_22.914878.p2 type:complete len:303 gc:universal NODE_59_length_4107_cov_22.914878:3095-4003(+)